MQLAPVSLAAAQSGHSFSCNKTPWAAATRGEFLGNPSLGVDNNALYVGGDMSTASTGAPTTTSAFVIRKSSVLGAGPVVVTAFRGLISGGEGPVSPRGVDNYDPAANEGYFIGSSARRFRTNGSATCRHAGSHAYDFSEHPGIAAGHDFVPNLGAASWEHGRN